MVVWAALYQVDAPPLEVVRTRKRRAQILTMRTFNQDEASIAGAVDVLEDICDELRLWILKHDDGDDNDGTATMVLASQVPAKVLKSMGAP